MKHLNSRWTAATLLIPVLLILGLLLSGGRAPEAAIDATKGTIEVSFEAVPTNGLPPIQAVDGNGNQVTAAAFAYQRLFLNVIAVRLNPSTDSQVSDFDSRWVSILVPSGVGANNTNAVVTTPFTGFGNFGPSGNAVSIGQGRSELQIDMNALQNGPAIFNAGRIPAKTYHQIELVLDPLTQGTVVPLCASSSPSGEGCVAYPAIFSPSNASARTVRTSGTIDMKRGSFQTLLININLTVGPPPTGTANNGNPSKNSVSITPSISASIGSQGLPGVGTLSGKLTNAGKNLKVVAEISGTNQVVATVGNVSGQYSMSLPAVSGNADCTSGGTLYDVYTSGTGQYNVHSGVRVCSAANTTLDLSIVASTVTQLTGSVADFCNNGAKIPSATLVLYVPDNNPPNDVSSCAFDSNGNVTPGCVAVGTAQTDAVGAFPMPGNSFTLVPFQTVPVKPPKGISFYYLKVIASGFNGLVEPITANGTTLKCKDLGNKNDSCNFVALERGQVKTTVNLSSANDTGATENILVMAEDQSTVGGSNTGLLNMEGVGMANIPPGQASGSVTFNIPDDGSAATPPNCDINTPNQYCRLGALASFDLFGQVQDLFFGIPQKATGHSIEVSPGNTGSAQCPSSPVSASLSGFVCVGHGSLAGNIVNSDPFSSVMLSKGGVNLMQTGVAPLVPANGQTANAFSFCAPGNDTYALQHFEDVPNTAPSPFPGGGPITVNVPAPQATATTGCAQICNQSSGQCLFCVNAMAGSMP